MYKTILTAQWFVKDHLQRGTEAKKREPKKKEEGQRLDSIQGEITQLNLKKSFLKEAIKEYHAEADKCAYKC